ncbi:gamma-tubulin complex component 2 [Drosophila hydei]|uniref:Gamma-tubulin complex component n=1 Tax=Drosophila hydei TaxID=7224 RepID=A0A6J1L580_DROHY|nr:gamma-tubulin complex component 2 [Drosophila hydei]
MDSKLPDANTASSSRRSSRTGDEHSLGDSELRDSVGSESVGEPERLKRKMGNWVFESVGGFYMPMEDVTKLTVQRQEELLIRNLIYAFSGVPASHIRPDIPIEEVSQLRANQIEKVRFKINENFSGAFRALANELLPLIGYYITVQSFIEDMNMTTGCGRSLGLALHNSMQQYFEMQAGLETQLQEKKLNLHQLVQLLRPWLVTMQSLANLTSRVRSLKLNSAQMLSLIYDHHAHFKCDRLKVLLTDVSHYYMKMVQLWTQKGVLYDMRKEFFIEDTNASDMSSTLLSPKQCCHAYWAKRYRLHLNRLPSFLEPEAESILLAGKYLNVLRQCNVQMKLMQASLSYVPDEQTHVQLIQSSYELPAQKLYEVLVQDQDLLQHLDNLQAYFLLQQLDFNEALIEYYSDQLQCNVDDLRPEKLHKITLKLLQYSSDPFKHLLRSQLMDCDVATQLTRRMKRLKAGTEQQMQETEPETKEEQSEQTVRTKQEEQTEPVKQLEKVEQGPPVKQLEQVQQPPAELELSSEAEDSIDLPEQLALYGYEALTLRYEPKWPISLILHEEALEQLQLLHRVLFYLHYVQRKLSSTSSNNARAVALHARMLQCIQQLEQHMTQDVVKPRWQSLLDNVQKAEFVDELMKLFQGTLDSCQVMCLLSEPVTFVRSLYTLGQLCLNYNLFLERQDSEQSFDSSLAEYEQEFNGLLIGILDLLIELARSNSSCGNEERQSCQQLLRRLEEISQELA